MICPQCGTLNQDERDECVRCRTRLHLPEMAGKIACVNHANREATTSCAGCGRRLCDACAVSANGVDFCDACAPSGALRPTYDEDYERVPVVDPATGARASFGGRVLGLAIDALLIFMAAIVLALLFWMMTSSLEFLSSPHLHPIAYWLYRVILALGAAAYFLTLTAMTGQTLGKQTAGVIVLQRDGRVITLRASAIRFLMSLVSAVPLGLGFWWALWDPDGETWHDKVSQTRVFRWDTSA